MHLLIWPMRPAAMGARLLLQPLPPCTLLPAHQTLAEFLGEPRTGAVIFVPLYLLPRIYPLPDPNFWVALNTLRLSQSILPLT